MKAKLVIAFIVVFGLGFYLGAMYLRLQEYARGGEHGLQAKELLGEIEDYKTHHGDYPDQDWFKDLGDKRITTEGRIWIYYNPPKKTSGGSQILISVPIDYGRMYLNGYVDGVVQSKKAGTQ
jgi:hypothetical protein